MENLKPPLKVNQKVRCIDSFQNSAVQEGQVYTVAHAYQTREEIGQMVYLKETVMFPYRADRFVPVSDKELGAA